MDTTPGMAVIPVFSPKGGVGKTTTTINLGAELLKRGFRVLCVDLDETGGLSGALMLGEHEPGEGLSAALVPELSRWRGDPRELIVVHDDGLHVIPTDADMEELGTAIAVRATGLREGRLSALLDQLAPFYDVCLLDCPPAQSIVTRSAMYAGRQRQPGDVSGPVIPMHPDPASDQALDKLLGWIAGLGPMLGATIEPLGLVINEYDPRNGGVPKRYLAKAQTMRDIPVLGVVKELTATQRAWEAGRPVAFFEPDAAITGMYAGIVDLITGEAAA